MIIQSFFCNSSIFKYAVSYGNMGYMALPLCQAMLGNEGVLCLLSDSTNAEQPGYTQSESKVGETFQSLFSKAGNRRIIIATFASLYSYTGLTYTSLISLPFESHVK